MIHEAAPAPGAGGRGQETRPARSLVTLAVGGETERESGRRRPSGPEPAISHGAGRAGSGRGRRGLRLTPRPGSGAPQTGTVTGDGTG